ncbi:NADH-quinone oxidoreductase subunit G [Helicobacter acinonychis]|uniref:NADH dehydrogenase I chain G n=1 Tax=Helicobacter acinonychis (strain Sheeba) TaxID=382638 RepID=Q17Z58_HELAH|nr:NADH-quinone oxidoreductase subunit G [Helicobacter acinonychis]CAJ99068.1 NADH dehydrogenase I chain G [Helicobacter acinonychis str. Sheeba]STP04813.1 NADH dehydrogenase subunit G [Helicobacter acinonychis]
MITMNINGKMIECQEGQSVLEAARSVGIYIPTICYLSGCSPTVACKMCMVEMDGKRIYSCNTKAKNNAVILTNTPTLMDERKSIMQTYDVNHPLECGVCDKSGECELQDMTHLTGVEHQPYAVADDFKALDSWAKALYDPNLCIMCERCVTTCKDNVGENNLKATKADLHAPDKFKDSMSKDAFSVWSRKQKGIISFVGSAPCYDCGECIAVCPVGALSYKDFAYTANAWELKKIHSTCSHCSAGCLISYDVRHFDTLGEESKIFRVLNDFYHNPICGAGRFAFDVSSSPKGSANLKEAQNALKECDAVRIGGDATNEEVFLIERLRKELNFKIYNKDLYPFQQFLKVLGEIKRPSIEEIKTSNLVITIGSSIKTENPLVRYAINNALKLNKASLIAMHPIKDNALANLCRSSFCITHEVGAEEILLGMLLKMLNIESVALKSLEDSKQDIADEAALKALEEERKKTLEQANQGCSLEENKAESTENKEENKTENKEEKLPTKTTYLLLEEVGINLETYEKILTLLQKSNNTLLVVGEEIYRHKQAHNIAKMLRLLVQKSAVKLILIPPSANALGIVSLCELSEEIFEHEKIVGIRAQGDFTINSDEKVFGKDAVSAVDFILPSLNQLEGTITNIEGRVLPLKPALRFEGYDLSDIMQGFSFVEENLVEYTHKLPKEAGFKAIEFDRLTNYFTNDRANHRGYELETSHFEKSAKEHEETECEPIKPLKEKIAFNAYLKYPETQFNNATNKSENLQLKAGIYVSKAFLKKLNKEVGQHITLAKEEEELMGILYLDESLDQEVFVVSPSLLGNGSNFFKESVFDSVDLKEQA